MPVKNFELDYSETIKYLYEKLPMFSRTGPKALKPDLKNTQKLCEVLDHPERKFKSVHIAGTNGKGSVSHMLAAIFQEHGFKTGLYTSPHIHDFRERIRINGRMIPEESVVDFVENTKEMTRKIGPSFFELTFAMAMKYFADEKVDVAVVETGLGGRLDSTNVIMPELSVITNIGWDHMDVLGDTLDKIAFEKAGIIKKNIPVVIGEVLPETREVFLKKAEEMNAPIFFAQEHFEIVREKTNELLELVVKSRDSHSEFNLDLDLKGVYQKKNIVTVLQAVEVLNKEFHFDFEKIKSALSQVSAATGFGGRWQIVHKNPMVVMDVGHNVNGFSEIIQQLSLMKYRALHIIIGMVKDKDITAVLKLLPKDVNYFFTNAHIPRALSKEQFQQKAGMFSLKGDVYEDVNLALKSALKISSAEDLILICGSFFVIAEVDLKIFQMEKPADKIVMGKN